MRRVLETKLRAERLAAKVRWIVLPAGAMLVFPQASNAALVIGFVVLGLAALASSRWGLRPRAYESFGCKLTTCLRAAEAAGAPLLCIHPALRADNLWLLAIPAILAEPMVSRRLGRAFAVALIGGVALAASRRFGGMSDDAVVVAGALYALAAITGLVLSSFQAREEILRAHSRRLDAVLECATSFAASEDLRATVLQTLKAAVTELGARAGYVMLTNADGEELMRTEAAYSPDGEFAFPLSLPIGTGVTGQAAQLGRPVAANADLDGRLRSEGVQEEARAAVSVPLIARSQRSRGTAAKDCALGAMTLVGRADGGVFGLEDIRLLRSLAALIAGSVANGRMEEQRQTTFLNTLETLAHSLEARDPYTSGHSQRTSEVSLMLGEALGFSADALEELRVGTILHDIGKIGVPDAVLQKPGKLDAGELAAMQRHAVVGYEICKPLVMSEGILLLIRNHHEKLDGSGYPDGLQAGDIPLSLRIICVADAFDAMSSRRPYRDVMDLARVQAELSRGAGTQFDPVVVEALRDLIPTARLQACYSDQWGSELGRAA